MVSQKWMTPELSLASQANLEMNLRIIRRDGPDHPERMSEYCCNLLQQNVHQQAIIASAARYIMELEAHIELGSRPSSRGWLASLRDVPGLVFEFFLGRLLWRS